MPRRSIWKGSFFYAFLLRMQNKRDLILNRKLWSRRSSISPEFVDCSVRIYNGKTPVRCKITEGKVGHKFGEFASTRKRRPSRKKIGPGKKRGEKVKSKRIWHEKEIRFR
uniref:ribosomal protein S19 n=1 Tax=Aconitum carmichaelii TaxID=85363 RepID=UPI002A82B0E5|nr:ribosomal protein S19 [Aconitum carmichaelii]WOV66897.1 ribosomal protein S19 [Aconitum carmichaelii]